jgi:release factor glutamine methyltransferase
MNSNIYTPREDSFLLLEEIKKLKIGSETIALDIGTGSGILAFELSKHSKKVYAVDINKEAIKKLDLKIKKKKRKNLFTICSNLFTKINKSLSFDLIVFNPPYIPVKKILFIDLDGGKNGTELIEKFLTQSKKHLKKDGKILLLSSSLNKNIERLFKKNKYLFKKIAENKIFFERLYVWELTLN